MFLIALIFAALAARSMVVDKLDKAVENLSCEEDEQEFIDCYKVSRMFTHAKWKGECILFRFKIQGS